MKLKSNKILHFELVQSNEVGGSCRMELAGFKLALEFLACHIIKVQAVVTNRHVEIKSFLRKNRNDITNGFDVWHVVNVTWLLHQVMATRT
ncbi:hypothetical protein V5799_017405 [Amblyomma americanum]|uniref:Uncharacterized protein n=1 Tax=Amblyomma americanum TaxID=6943 RepID=A0AAQ4F2B8_AMBAM